MLKRPSFFSFLLLVVLPSILQAQTIAISPASITKGTTVNFQVTGSNTVFSQATGARIFQSPWVYPNPTYGNSQMNIVSDTVMSVPIHVPLNAASGSNYVFEVASLGWSVQTPVQVIDSTPPPPVYPIQVFPDAVYRGSTTNFLVTGTNTTFSMATGARIFLPPQNSNPNYIDQQPVINSNTSLNAGIYIPPNAALANNYVFQVEGPGAIWQRPITVIEPPAGNARIQGHVTINFNAPCFGGSPPLANRVIQFLPGPYFTITDAQGFYEAWLPHGNYAVSIANQPPYTSVICPVNPFSSVFADSAASSPAVADFHLDILPVSDVQARIFINAHRPGFNTTNYVQVSNPGPLTANNVVVKLYIDQGETYIGSTPQGTLVGDTLTWNLGSLISQATQTLYFTVFTSTANTNGTVRYWVFASSSTTEIDEENNADEIVGPITSSYDPNDKQVWNQDNVNADGPISPSDSLLRYLIRFQNTGTDTAFNIHVTDVLDANLDPGSLQFLSSSHDFYTRLENGNELTFFFPDILLPDSNRNEPLSHGHVEYALALRPGLPPGTKISNEANIYFDFNAPVLTNAVTSQICTEAHLDFSWSANGPDVTFSNLSTGTPGSFQWEFGDGSTSIIPAPVHAYPQVGVYTACLHMTDTCGLRSICRGVEVTSMTFLADPDLSGGEFSLFPNPNTGTFTVEADWLKGGALSWSVQDLQGRKLLSGQEAKVIGFWKKQIDARNLAPGTYVLRVEVNGRRFHQKFSIQ